MSKFLVSFKDFQGEVEVPGMFPLAPMAMPKPVMNKKSGGYDWFVYQGGRLRETDGLIANTFAELEPTTLKSIANAMVNVCPTIIPLHQSILWSSARSRQQIARPRDEPIDGMARPTSPVIRGLLVLRKSGCLLDPTIEGNSTWSRA